MQSSIAKTLALVALTALPIDAIGLDKAEFRKAARDAEAQLRSEGEPKDRCSLGAFVTEGGIVLQTFSTTPLIPGDRLLSVGGTDVSTAGVQQIFGVLRQIGPTDFIDVSVERNGETVPLDLQCSNARPGMQARMKALNLAARGRFGECAEAFGQLTEVSAEVAAIHLQCAALSDQYPAARLAELTVSALRMAIDDARWIPQNRRSAIQRLRAAEGFISGTAGPQRFDDLVTLTRSWPGDERLYEATTPNWSRFRQVSESALRDRLIDPDSAQVEWLHGFIAGSWKPIFSKPIEGYWTCGAINARNRMGGYVGKTSFVVVLSPDAEVRYVEIGQQRDFDILTAQCNNAAGLLPAPQRDLSDSKTRGANTQSIADELGKLVELRNQGALTEAEFQRAKQRLLETPE